MKLFQNRKLVIATKHGKEKVIAPILEKELGVKCFVPEDFDTDQWGTFSGEIARNEDVLNTLRNKSLHAMKRYDCDLAIASEGSFGAHPSIFFAQADDEALLFMDAKNDLEITAREISLNTNCDGRTIENKQELLAFAEKVLFPSHGLIMKSSENNFKKAIKGITDKKTLLESFENMTNEFGTVYLETDMRALYNPTRMEVIEKATLQLVQTIKTQCPKCDTPGFSVTEIQEGLPCEWCKSPTRSTLSHVYGCKKCHFTVEKKYPNQKTKEDPMYCDFCNP
ncbi:DUF6671 family protein [Flavobacterium sp.]|uniref:DUF6671 family protein n=1 Tax=Flavobacterium sp. TaxID=239 RepID=UPI00262F87D6|nr:DUF6671 family protein [Flavobacterium sp.]